MKPGDVPRVRHGRLPPGRAQPGPDQVENPDDDAVVQLGDELRDVANATPLGQQLADQLGHAWLEGRQRLDRGGAADLPGERDRVRRLEQEEIAAA